MKPQETRPDVHRRDFMKAGSLAAFMAALGGVPIEGQEAARPGAAPVEPPLKPDPNYKEKPPAPPVNFGVIGLGAQGREILTQLNKLPNAPVVALCDNYRPAFRRALEAAPKAATHTAPEELLARPEVQAVVVATPTHLHREIALAAMKAGKHVYLEAPLAHTVEDARAVAAAAQALPARQIFQAGLQLRENPQNHHVAKFVRTGASGRLAFSRGQANRKQSWRRTSPNAERERALNWRLYRETSIGLAGEVGIHSLDVARWYHDRRPVAVTGYGGILQWQDDREVADTVNLIVEFPGGVRHVYSSTLACSFEGEHDVFYGSDAAILIRDNKGWMFKETDAPLLGWEVYARKDDFLNESGIALVANATKILAQGKKPAEAASESDVPLRYALEKFIEHIAEGTKPDADAQAGFEATVLAIRAHEAVIKGGRIELAPELFRI